jgi:hypothetical protein
MNPSLATQKLTASTRKASTLRKGNSHLRIHKYKSDRTAQKNEKYKGYGATSLVAPLKARRWMLQKQGR